MSVCSSERTIDRSLVRRPEKKKPIENIIPLYLSHLIGCRWCSKCTELWLPHRAQLAERCRLITDELQVSELDTSIQCAQSTTTLALCCVGDVCLCENNPTNPPSRIRSTSDLHPSAAAAVTGWRRSKSACAFFWSSLVQLELSIAHACQTKPSN